MGSQPQGKSYNRTSGACSISFLAAGLALIAAMSVAQEAPMKRFGYRITNTYPSDINAFTPVSYTHLTLPTICSV